MQFFLLPLCLKIQSKESIHPSLGEKNYTNRGTPVVSCILVVLYVKMYAYLVQDQVFHTGSAIFHVISSAYSTCSGLASGPVSIRMYYLSGCRVVVCTVSQWRIWVDISILDLANYRKLILDINLVSKLVGFIFRALSPRQFESSIIQIYTFTNVPDVKNVRRNANRQINSGSS